MEILMQRRTVSAVRREYQPDTIVSETLWLDRERELKGVIRAETASLKILEAYVEVLKSPADAPGIIRCPFPPDADAFIGGKRHAAGFVSLPEGKAVKYLMVQCINAVIQAETYFWKERGFPDPESYNAYWDELEVNGCRMYSHPDPEDLRWLDYAPQGRRELSLFHRIKNARILRRGDRLVCSGDFTDSYHEISLELVCDAEDGVIRNCEIQYIRAPGKSCFCNDAHEKDLLGRNLFSLTKNEVLDLAGRSEGCYHLVEILKDILMCAEEIALDFRKQE